MRALPAPGTRRGLYGAVAVVTMSLISAGCNDSTMTSSSITAPESQRLTAAIAPAVPEAPQTTSTPGIPAGEAAIAPAPTTPVGSTVAPPVAESTNVCTQIAASTALLGLDASFRLLADPDHQAEGAQQLHAATADLRAIAQGPSGLSGSLEATAAALDGLVASGFTETGISAVETAIGQLGTEVQTLCNFPIA